MSECKMNVKVLQSATLTATRYLIIAVAMLHTSLGATPQLQVIYSANGMDDKVSLKCRDQPSGLIVSGATFTFKEPGGRERMEDSVRAVGSSYTFTIHPDNESLVTCTIESRESDPVKVAAIPRYTAGVTAIKQYMYSDSAVVDIECPFQIGRLRELYEFSWDGVLGPGDVQPITNGTVGVYWLDEEDNRTLHVNISAATTLKGFQCVGEVQTCQTSSLCQPTERNSPTITITTTADLPMITNHPNSTTVNEGEVVTFSCTMTGHGYPTIEWDMDEVRYNMDNCSASENCNRINITDNTDGSLTSTLEITASLINNSVTCVITISFGQSVVGVESRPPPIRILRSEPAQLTVIAAPATTHEPITSSDDQSKTYPSEGGSHDIHTAESNSVGTQIILAVVLLFLIISIIVLVMCIFAIFHYHYKNKESWLGQRLRQTFKIDPALATYAVPTYTRENHDTELAPQREVTIAMAHPIYEEVGMMMQENSAYGTDVAIAPEIATERNAAYGHFGTSGGEEIASTSNDTISHQLLQHFETAMGHPVNEDEYESRTDATSTTAYSMVFPCPITMNLPGTRVETLV